MKTGTYTNTNDGTRWKVGRKGMEILPPLAPVSLAVVIHETGKTKRSGGFSHTWVGVYVRLLDAPSREILREHYCGAGWWIRYPTPRSGLGKARIEAEKVAAEWRRDWLGEQS